MFSPSSFSMNINNSPSSVLLIQENRTSQSGDVYNTNGVNFETLLHEALHSSTLAHILSINKIKNPKAVKAYKELTLTKKKVNDYIYEKTSEWIDLINDGKIEELDKIRAKESLTMQKYIDILKSKNKRNLENITLTIRLMVYSIGLLELQEKMFLSL